MTSLKRIVIIEKYYYFKINDVIKININRLNSHNDYWNQFKDSIGIVINVGPSECVISWSDLYDRERLPCYWYGLNLIRVNHMRVHI